MIEKIKNDPKKTKVTIKITPRSSKNEVLGIMDDGAIKIKLVAPPVDGKANQALIKFLSEILHTSNSNIEIVSGHTSRTKIIAIIGFGNEEVTALFKDQIKA